MKKNFFLDDVFEKYSNLESSLPLLTKLIRASGGREIHLRNKYGMSCEAKVLTFALYFNNYGEMQELVGKLCRFISVGCDVPEHAVHILEVLCWGNSSMGEGVKQNVSRLTEGQEKAVKALKIEVQSLKKAVKGKDLGGAVRMTTVIIDDLEKVCGPWWA